MARGQSVCDMDSPDWVIWGLPVLDLGGEVVNHCRSYGFVC